MAGRIGHTDLVSHVDEKRRVLHENKPYERESDVYWPIKERPSEASASLVDDACRQALALTTYTRLAWRFPLGF